MFLRPRRWARQLVHSLWPFPFAQQLESDSPNQHLGRASNLHAAGIGARPFLVAGSCPVHWRSFSSIPASAHRYECHPPFVTTKLSQTLPHVTWEPKPLLVRNPGLKEDVSPTLEGYRLLPSHPGWSLREIILLMLMQQHIPPQTPLLGAQLRLSRNTGTHRME